MPERIRSISGLVRPEERGSGALSVGAAGTAGEGWCQQLQGVRSLLWDDAVAERGELRRTAEPRSRGDPAGVEALHPLHEVRAEPTGRVCGGRGRAGEALPSGDGGSVRSPSPVRAPASGVSSAQRGRTTADKGGRHPFPGRRPGVPVSLALGVGNNDAAALGRVMSPLPCRWFGEPLIPSDAFGVGSSSHSTSSARFGPCPPLFRFDVAAAVLPDVAGRRLQQGARRAMRRGRSARGGAGPRRRRHEARATSRRTRGRPGIRVRHRVPAEQADLRCLPDTTGRVPRRQGNRRGR